MSKMATSASSTSLTRNEERRNEEREGPNSRPPAEGPLDAPQPIDRRRVRGEVGARQGRGTCDSKVREAELLLATTHPTPSPSLSLHSQKVPKSGGPSATNECNELAVWVGRSGLKAPCLARTHDGDIMGETRGTGARRAAAAASKLTPAMQRASAASAETASRPARRPHPRSAPRKSPRWPVY